MIKYQIFLSHKAREDIIDIGDYIAHTLQEPDNSKKFIHSLKKSISQLQLFPNKFPIVQYKRYNYIRRMPYKNYYVFYEVVEERHHIHILRVGYAHRNWKELLKSYINIRETS